MIAVGVIYLISIAFMGLSIGGMALFSTGPPGLGLAWGLGMALLALLMLLAPICYVIGVWQLTARDPQRPPESSWLTARQSARWGSLLGMLGMFAPGTEPVLNLIASGFLHGIWLAGNLGLVVVMYRLAQRIPSNQLAKHWRIVGWGITAAAAVGLAGTVVSLGLGGAGFNPGLAGGGGAGQVSGGGGAAGPGAGTSAPGQGQAAPTAAPILVSIVNGTAGIGYLVFSIWGFVLIVLFGRHLKRLAETSPPDDGQHQTDEQVSTD
jgi:hypothetical protein